jgi:PAS domain S-box-containing protein
MPDSLPSPARGAPAPPRPAATVLIVTAEGALGARIEALLARMPRVTCFTARNGPVARERLSRGKPDVALIDLPLPGLSGQGLLEWPGNAGQPVPFLALIGPGEERLGLELMRGGALDCLVKDARLFERLPPAMERALQRLVQQRQLAADLAAMNRLHELSTRLLEVTGLSQLLEEVLEATIALQGADFGNVQLYNRQTEALEIVAQRGFGPEFLERFRAVPNGVGSCGLALQRRQRVIIEDTEADPAYAPCRAAAASAGYRAVQSTPMFSRDGEPLGMLSTHFRQPHRPSERELRLTDLYVRHAAGLIERKRDEEALRASEARYRALVHATSQAVWRLSADGERQLSLEGPFVRGHSEPEANPGDWLSRIHPEDRARTLEAWRRAVAAQSLYEIEHRVVAADGGYRCLHSRGVPVRDADGEVLEWIGASADITGRKRADAALRESEERYRRVSESGFINLAFFSADGRITDANDAFLQLVGFSRAELNAGLVRWDQITPPEWLARTRQALEEFKATGRISPYEKEYFRRDGSRFWALVGGAKLEGRPEGVAFALDITERKQAEIALREREAQLAFAQRVGRVGVWGRDLVTGTSFVTEEWCEIVGVQDPALVRSLPEFLALVHPDDRPRVQAANRRTIRTGRDMDLEFRILHPERGERWMLARARYLPPADGKGHRLLGVIIDITERKRAEEALRASEGRFVAFMDNLPGCAWMKDGCGRYAYLNKRLAQLPEYRGDCLGKTDAELLPASIAAHYQGNDQKVMAEKKALQTIEPYVTEGDHRYMLVSKFPIFNPAGVVALVGGVGIDVTEQKRAEEQLRLSEERLRFAAQAAGFGWYDLDLVAGQGYGSPELKALFGLEPQEEWVLDAEQLPVGLHPDDRALVRKAVLESRNPQGAGAKDLECRILLPDGTVRWLLARGRAFFEGEGAARRPVRARGIALDITERKQLEQEVLEIGGREQRRIGHDLHDDLCQRLGGLQLLSGVLEKDLAAEGHPRAAQAGQLLARVQEALEQARRLARGLAPVGLEDDGLVTALQALAENSSQLFRIRCELRAEAPVALADAGAATHLYRIAQEAITNAVRHGRASRVTLGLNRAGDGFELKVSDNGRGFRPPVSTSGMGLRIMKYRAGVIGATLEMRSDAGQGATVTCTFSKDLCAAQRIPSGRG